MVQTPLPLTALSEEQRAQALQGYDIIRPALEKQTSQAQVARTHQLSPSTVQLWIKQYRRITQGNMRLIDRLMKQVERVLTANQLTVVTKEVVETARKNLIIGFE